MPGEREIPNFDDMGAAANEAFQYEVDALKTNESTTPKSTESNKQNGFLVRAEKAGMAAILALTISGCSARAEGYKEELTPQQMVELADKFAREVLEEEGASEEEINHLLKGQEYLDAITEMRKELKDVELNEMSDFQTWLEEQRKDPLAHGSNNPFIERRLRATSPETIGYEGHQPEKPEPITPTRLFLDRMPFSSDLNWEEIFNRLVTGPTTVVTIDDWSDLRNYREKRGNFPIEADVFYIAVDELNPGLLYKMGMEESPEGFIEIIVPDLKQYGDEAFIKEEVVEALMGRTKTIKVDSVRYGSGNTVEGSPTSIASLRADFGLEVNRNDYIEAIHRLNPEYDFGENGTTLRPDTTLVVPSRE